MQGIIAIQIYPPFFFCIVRSFYKAQKEKEYLENNIFIDYKLSNTTMEYGHFNLALESKITWLEITQGQYNSFLLEVFEKIYLHFLENCIKEYSFVLKIPPSCFVQWETEEFNIDKRIFFHTSIDNFYIEWKYKGTECFCSEIAHSDLQTLFSIFQYKNFLQINESVKKPSGTSIYSKFTKERPTLHSQNLHYLMGLWKNYLENLFVSLPYTIQKSYYQLLSEKFEIKRLRLALEYLVAANHEQSISSINFLNYWLAIEIMLGEKGKKDITESIKNKISLLYENKEEQESFMKKWKLRGNIIHTGKPLHVAHEDFREIKDLSSNLFQKLLSSAKNIGF